MVRTTPDHYQRLTAGAVVAVGLVVTAVAVYLLYANLYVVASAVVSIALLFGVLLAITSTLWVLGWLVYDCRYIIQRMRGKYVAVNRDEVDSLPFDGSKDASKGDIVRCGRMGCYGSYGTRNDGYVYGVAIKDGPDSDNDIKVDLLDEHGTGHFDADDLEVSGDDDSSVEYEVATDG